ncbi:class I SAM-dependent methyltransferase [Faunimonas sp. B44]|uniref:class I SAM-dependent methyltransferase n=1 Tax=Faunimonas sp. B44 TaxID=3461493 RepID=UPI0040441D5A
MFWKKRKHIAGGSGPDAAPAYATAGEESVVQANPEEDKNKMSETQVRATEEPAEYIRELYAHILRREPGEAELKNWVAAAEKGMSQRDIFHAFVTCDEYKALRGAVEPGHPVGHYYSPVVDPSELVGARKPKRNVEPEAIAGIDLSLPRMRAFWMRHAEAIRATPYSDDPDGKHRFYAHNDIFPIGDATILRAMILANRPKRIIEIGSGFSSAVMLDTIEEAGLDTNLVLIEPYTERLRSRLRAEDNARVRIVEKPVQEVPVDEFRTLESNDILFIDSTHVLKTGSDVHYELFSILPALKPGVLIHFHDIPYPFEYPDLWIYERRYSWNEAYAVRAFLMYNWNYQVEFMNGLFHMKAADAIKEVFPRFSHNPGASLWIRKLS